MNLAVRAAAEADVPAVLRLYAQLGMGHGPSLRLDEALPIFRRVMGRSHEAIYVAEESADAPAVVGTFAMLIMESMAHRGAPSAVVEDVCVDEARRGGGIGRAMMEFAMRVARAHGCYKLTLSSNLARTGAHAFYRALGFEQHGVSFHVRLKG